MNTTEKSKKGSIITILFFLIIYVLYTAYMINVLGIDGGVLSGFLIGGRILEILQIFVFPPLLCVLMAFIAIFLSPLFLKLALFMKKGKYDIAVQDFHKKTSAKEIVSRSFFAILFSTATSLSFNNALHSFGVHMIFDTNASVSLIYSTAAMAIYITPLAIIILLPMWTLEDIGLILYKIKGMSDSKNHTYDFASVGSFFTYLLKGFAGITTPVMYVYLFITSANQLNELMLLLLIIPFVGIGVYSLSLLIYTFILPKYRKFFFERHSYQEIVINAEITEKKEIPEVNEVDEVIRESNDEHSD